MQEGEIELLQQLFCCLTYVGGITGFSKNIGTTIYDMTVQYWKSVVAGFENRLVSPRLILPQRKTARGIVLWDENCLTEV